MCELKKNIWKFIDKYKTVIFFILITIVSILIRISVLDRKSDDFVTFLAPWFQKLKENNGLYALKMDIGNYNAPYMTLMAILTYLPFKPIILIKSLSIIFDYVLAIAVTMIVRYIYKQHKNKEVICLAFYSVILFLPTVILNSAYWAQADAIYTAFIMLSLFFLIKKRYTVALIFLGISFAFKLQFIFILPLYIFIYASERRFSVWNFLIIPLVDAVLCVPAIIFGKSIYKCITVYLGQTSEYSAYLSMNFPNIYNLLFPTKSNFVISPNGSISKLGILFTLFIFFVILLAIMYKKIKFDEQKIIEFGLWSVMIATFFLPSMHERYLFIGDILSVLYFIYNKDKIYIPIGISMVSLYGYSFYLFNQSIIPIQYASILYLILIILVSKNMCKKYFYSNTKEKQEQNLINKG